MGSIAAQFKIFMDKLGCDFWIKQKWADKIAAGFTVVTYPSGDKLSTINQLAIFAAQQGMVWVGQNQIGSQISEDDQGTNDSSSWLGLMATSSKNKDTLIDWKDAQTAKLFGKRVAEATLRWSKF